jgi:hypothetical protein
MSAALPTGPIASLIQELQGMLYDLGTGVGDTWTLSVGTATSFTLTVTTTGPGGSSQVTGSITAAGLTAGAIQSALEALSNVGSNVLVTGSGPYGIQFTGPLAGQANVVSISPSGGSAAVDTADQDVPLQVWYSVIPNALRSFGRGQPLFKPFTIDVVDGDRQETLPSDFLDFDYFSLMLSAYPKGLDFTYRSYIFALMSTTGASSDLSSATYGVPYPFATWTQFNVVDDGMGGKILTFAPAAIKTWALHGQYYATQALDTLNNTVPDSKRDLLVFRCCDLACRALARLLAGNQKLFDAYMRMGYYWKEQYEEKTKFRPLGMIG